MDWTRILAYITGTVDQELLLCNEYLAAENRILKAQLKTPLRLTDAERMTLAEIAHRLGRKALEDVANVVKPDTLLGWYRRLVARKFDGSKSRRYPGRPRIDDEIEQWVVRMAKENSDWGYGRIVGAMANLGYRLSAQTVGNILHDRDTKYCQSFRNITESGDVKTLPLPARSTNLNAFSERWVKSVKDDCLSKLILSGENSLRSALHDYLVHYHAERNHQGKGNVLLFPTARQAKNRVDESVHCKERLGGLLKYYHREAA